MTLLEFSEPLPEETLLKNAFLLAFHLVRWLLRQLLPPLRVLVHLLDEATR
jgi:hypothetical protein